MHTRQTWPSRPWPAVRPDRPPHAPVVACGVTAAAVDRSRPRRGIGEARLLPHPQDRPGRRAHPRVLTRRRPRPAAAAVLPTGQWAEAGAWRGAPTTTRAAEPTSTQHRGAHSLSPRRRRCSSLRQRPKAAAAAAAALSSVSPPPTPPLPPASGLPSWQMRPPMLKQTLHVQTAPIPRCGIPSRGPFAPARRPLRCHSGRTEAGMLWLGGETRDGRRLVGRPGRRHQTGTCRPPACFSRVLGALPSSWRFSFANRAPFFV
jgi:hypothetical protein